MGLVERNSIIANISPPFEHILATQLVDEFISMERKFIQRDWEASSLDGGQFAEISSRILYQQDSGFAPFNKEFADCIRYLENKDVSHNLPNRKQVAHFVKVLQAIYKFRSERGAVHISNTYQPNHMDSKFLIESVRWCMNELLRVFWNGDRETVAKVIKELLQFDVPCIGTYEDIPLVQRTDLSVQEEILLLLHYAGLSGCSRTELGQSCMFPAPRITEALSHLKSPKVREIRQLSTGRYVLMELGHRRIRNELADKLLVQ